jgi:hypothetical protein
VRRKFLLLLLTLVAGLLIGEFGLRVSGLARPVMRAYVGEFENRPLGQDFVADPFTGWRPRADHEFRWDLEGREIPYRIDARGRRIGSAEPARGPRTLMVAGDSFSFGVGVLYEESFARRIADRLGGFELQNISAPGYGLDQIWLSIREALREERPDLLVVGLYPNDFDRSLTAYRELERLNKPLFLLEGGALRRQTTGDRPGALALWLERSSRLVAGYRSADRRLGWTFGLGHWWNLNRSVLEAIQEEGRRRGVPVVFVYLPSKRWERFPALERELRESGAHFVNLIELNPERPEGAFFEDDPHMTASAHALIGEQVADWILERGPEVLPE